MKNFLTSGFRTSYIWLACLSMLALPLVTGCASSEATQERSTPPDEELEVGYGTIDSDRNVGSVSTVDVESAQVTQPRTLADLLRGRVAGVQVTELAGGGISVRIRGTGSFRSSNEPLYVIDDMIMQIQDGNLYHINPHDIASISVLKDASATAIYGVRGANGVILIKTKRGR